MNASVELTHVPAKWAPVRRQEHAPLNNSGNIQAETRLGQDTVAVRLARPSKRDEREVSSGWLVVATIWSALLAYACVQALLAG